MFDLPVIFKKHKFAGEWSVTAFFPTLPASASNPYDLLSYAHIGQHGAASVDYFHTGKKCKPEEYESLLNELKSIYETGEGAVKLKVCQKISQKMFNQRVKNWKR